LFLQNNFSPGRFVKGLASPRLRFAACAAIVAFLCVAEASSAQTSPVTPAPTPVYREVTDETGRTVRIPQPVRRIVSLAPSLTETVYALGLQDYLVGVTDYCDYPPDAQKKTKVGGTTSPSLEQIAALHPDLVLATSINRFETENALDALGIASYGTDPHTVDEIMTSTKKLANVLGAPDAGVAVTEDMQRRLATLQQRIGALPAKHVLFVVWTQPLISIGKNTFIADALRRAGAVSIVDSEQDWPQISLEEIARLQPEYLVLASSHSESAPRELDVLATLPGWSIVDAVSNRHFAVISDAVNRPAPRIVSAIEDLARQLHPDAFIEKPENGKEKIEKENPLPNQRPFSPTTSVSYDLLHIDTTTRGGCACDR
jgi:iron complex transport system substrate-binding protein